MNKWLKRFKRPKTVAVDFDRRRLKVVHFAGSRLGPRIEALRSAAVPADVDMSSAQAAGEFLRRVLDDMGLAGADVHMNVPRSKAVLKVLSLPTGTDEGELAGMVQYQIANELPFDAAEAVVDFTIAPRAIVETGEGAAEQTRDVLAAAVRLPVVDFYRRMAEVAGCHPASLCLRPASNLFCLDGCVRLGASECVALVDITADETEIDFIVGASLVFSRSASLAEAGVAGEELSRQRIVQTVVTEMLRSLQSFQVGHRGGKVERVFVCGPSDVAGDVVNALHQRTQIRCEQFDMTRALDLAPDPSASTFSAALGAAMRPAPNAGFDFLHPRRPVVRTDGKQKRMATLIAAGACFVLLCVLCGWWAISSRTAAAEELSRQAKAEEETWMKKVNPTLLRLQKVEGWQGRQVDLLGHMLKLSSLLPGPADFYITRLEFLNSTITFDVHTRGRETIDQLEELLSGKGYHIPPSTVPQSKTNNLGYIYESRVEATLDANTLRLPLDPVPLRPADDTYAAGASSPSAAAPAAAVAPAAPVTPPPAAPAATPAAAVAPAGPSVPPVAAPPAAAAAPATPGPAAAAPVAVQPAVPAPVMPGQTAVAQVATAPATVPATASARAADANAAPASPPAVTPPNPGPRQPYVRPDPRFRKQPH